MLTGLLLALDVLGMLVVMFWSIRQERAAGSEDKSSAR